MQFRFPMALLIFVATCGNAVFAADWLMFGRDQTRNAVSPEKNPPTWWQPEERDTQQQLLKPSKNIRWSARLGAHTYGDPVVVGGMVWIGTNNTGQGQRNPLFLCLDEQTGKVLYRYVSPSLRNWQDPPWLSLACSPLIEGDQMWFASNRCEVVCLDIGPLRLRKGAPRELWKVDMRKDLGVSPSRSIHDCRLCSVASYRDRIFVITGNGVRQERDKVAAPEAPSLVCFHKHTGKILWKDNSPGNNILHAQFASPTVVESNGKVQVVAPQGDGWVRSFDALTGKLLWKFDTNPPDAVWHLSGNGTRNYLPATAVFYENRLYIGNGQEPEHDEGPAWLYCIDPSQSGDISPHLPNGPGKGKPNPNSGMIWKFGGVDAKTKLSIFCRTVSNVAIDKGLVIAPDLGGTIHCLDAQTGRQYWAEDVGASIYGSPLIVAGKAYVGTDNDVWIFDLTKEKKILGQIRMGGRVRCSPIFANGVLYVATDRMLFAIAGSEKKPKQ